MKPLNNYILIKPIIEEENKTSGGIYMPQNMTNTPNNFLNKGEVIAINKSCEELNEGCVVLYNKNAVANIPENKELKLVRIEDIYAIM